MGAIEDPLDAARGILFGMVLGTLTWVSALITFFCLFV
jgi:hypothetical protein